MYLFGLDRAFGALNASFIIIQLKFFATKLGIYNMCDTVIPSAWPQTKISGGFVYDE